MNWPHIECLVKVSEPGTAQSGGSGLGLAAAGMVTALSRQAVCNKLARVGAAADGNDNILLAIKLVGHR
jgi:hypothetical protein